MATGLLVGSGFALHAILRIQASMNTTQATCQNLLGAHQSGHPIIIVRQQRF